MRLKESLIQIIKCEICQNFFPPNFCYDKEERKIWNISKIKCYVPVRSFPSGTA